MAQSQKLTQVMSVGKISTFIFYLGFWMALWKLLVLKVVILILICFHLLCVMAKFLRVFSLFASRWSLWVACERPFAPLCGFSLQVRGPAKGPPNKHIAAIKGCFGNTSLTFARHPHNSGCKIGSDWDECLWPHICKLSGCKIWPMGSAFKVLLRYATDPGGRNTRGLPFLSWLTLMRCLESIRLP